MAIIRMTTELEADLPNVETIHNYPGHETGRWFHSWECPNYKTDNKTRFEALPGCLPSCHGGKPLYMKTTHVGLVLAIGEKNGRDDSDFYADVWNPETQSPERIEYATTRGWTYPNHAFVDASPEIVAAHAAYQAEVVRRHREIKAAEEAKVPRVGKLVKVVRGRKVPIGTIGRVSWAGKDKFKRNYYQNPHRWMLADVMVLDAPERVGIDTETGRVFMSAENVEVIPDGAGA